MWVENGKRNPNIRIPFGWIVGLVRGCFGVRVRGFRCGGGYFDVGMRSSGVGQLLWIGERGA